MPGSGDTIRAGTDGAIAVCFVCPCHEQTGNAYGAGWLPSSGLLLLLTGSIADTSSAEPESDQEAPRTRFSRSLSDDQEGNMEGRQATWKHETTSSNTARR